MRKKFLMLGFALVLWVCQTGIGFAGIKFGVSPSNYEFDFAPGASQEARILLSNQTDKDCVVAFKVQDWDMKPGTSALVFSDPESSDRSCAGWITLKQESVTVPAGQEAYVDFVITAPKEAVGGYRAVVFAESFFGSEKIDNIVMPNVVAKIGCIIYYAPRGQSYSHIDFEDIVFSRPDDDKSFRLGMKLKNMGNSHFIGTGNALVLDADGTTVGRVVYPRIIVLEEHTNTIMSKWDGQLKPGAYEIISTLDQGPDKPPLVKTKKFEVKKSYKASLISEQGKYKISIVNDGNVSFPLGFRISVAADGDFPGWGKTMKERMILPDTSVKKRLKIPENCMGREIIVEVVSEEKVLETIRKTLQQESN